MNVGDLYYVAVNKDNAIFETEETEKIENEFYQKYIDKMLSTDRKTGLDMESSYLNSLCEREKSGFIIGFNAAIQLLIGGKTL